MQKNFSQRNFTNEVQSDSYDFQTICPKPEMKYIFKKEFLLKIYFATEALKRRIRKQLF